MHLKGTITALITPFKDDKVDEAGLRENIRFQLSQGIDGLLLIGSTGEACTLTAEEQAHVISIGVQEAKGKVPLLVGTGSNSTQFAIENTKRARELGADAALIVTPYYNKPTQEGIFKHFEAINNQVDLPIVVYNNPSRSIININVETLLRLTDLPNVIAIKEAANDMSYISQLLRALKNKNSTIPVLSGDDGLTYPMMTMGAAGVISVLSNLVPAQVAALTTNALKKNYEAALNMHFDLLPLYKVAFIETNPIPIKAAMHLCGRAAGTCRLPLCEISQNNKNVLSQVLEQLKLVSSSAS